MFEKEAEADSALDRHLQKHEEKREKVASRFATKSQPAIRKKKKKSVTISSHQTQPLQLSNLSVFIENLERTGNPKQASEAASRAIRERKGRMAFNGARSKSQSRHINVDLQRPAVTSMRGTYTSMNKAYPQSGGNQSNLRTSAQSHAHMTFGTGALVTGQGGALPLLFETQKVATGSYA